MKCTLEFGEIGGVQSSKLVIPTESLAAELAYDIARAFGRKQGHVEDFEVMKGRFTRQEWKSSTHFVTVTLGKI